MQQRILVVEDEAGIAENISYALQTEGYDVKWCSTVGEAREVIPADGIDLASWTWVWRTATGSISAATCAAAPACPSSS
jgi:DNA-binding response OmpR family regulator